MSNFKPSFDNNYFTKMPNEQDSVRKNVRCVTCSNKNKNKKMKKTIRKWPKIDKEPLWNQYTLQMISSNKLSSILSSLSIFVLLVIVIILTYQVRLLYHDYLKQRRLEQYKADLDLIQSQFDQVHEDIDQVRQEFDIYKKYGHWMRILLGGEFRNPKWGHLLSNVRSREPGAWPGNDCWWGNYRSLQRWAILRIE